MKILVISDTHRQLNNVNYIINKTKDINRIIHLGDSDKDAEELLYTQPYIVDYVAGNCDLISKTAKEKILTINNLKILITHGHYYNVKWEYNSIRNITIQKKVDITLFGHTHVSYFEQTEKYTLFNPGSISMPRDGKGPSYGLIELDEKGIPHFTINFIKKNKFKC